MNQGGSRAVRKKVEGFQTFGRILCLLSLPTVNIISYLINPEYAAMMLFPLVIFLNRVGNLPAILTLIFLVMPLAFLWNSGNMDAFVVVSVHSLFYLLLSLLQTEPFFLLTIHCLTSSLMLLDAPTVLAVVVAVAAAIMAFGSCEVATDRVAVFLISITFATMLGNLAAILTSVVMAGVLVFLKLRPLKLPAICILVLHVLGVVVLVDRHIAAFVAVALTLAITVASVTGKLRRRCSQIGIMGNDNHNDNYNIININNNNINDHISTPSHMHNGCLRLSNPTDSLDLQGHTVTSALQALHQFLASHEEVYKKNRTGHTRHLKVITGEGGFHASQEMVNLIKPTVANFLKINKYRFDVSRENPGIMTVDLESHAL